jgi:uncharacterized protein YoxC
MSVSIKDVVDQFDQNISKLESQLQGITEKSSVIYRKTTMVIRTVFISIGLLMLVNLYFIFDFASNILVMINSMEAMYTHFGNVTEQVHGMTGDVKNMSENVALMPAIADKMGSMNGHVQSMTQNVDAMQGNVAIMKEDVVGINADMGQMSQRFVNVNQSMDGMVGNVNQMSRPIP